MTFWKLVLVSLTMMIFSGVKGQSINSPYTINGIGEIAFDGMPNNYGMGEVGIGAPTLWHINIQNPANLIYNTFSSFQVGIVGDFRSYASAEDTHSSGTASLRFMAMSFPLKKGKWSTAISLTPLSTVQYNTYSIDTVGLATRVSQSQGEGGLTQLSWAHGIRLYKSLALGIKASYIFGEINRSTRDQLSGPDVGSSNPISYVESTNYSDFLFSTGLSYRLNVKGNNFLNIGANYELSRTLQGSKDIYFERLSLAGATIQQTTVAEGAQANFDLPITYALGLSYEKLNTVQVGFDLKLKQWESSGNETTGTLLRDTYSIGLGAGWTPDYESVNNYLKRATYRLGFSVNQLPYLINNTEINDFGINFGASFPVSGYSSMDLALKYGTRGTTQNSLIMENYFQVIIGATINDANWFIKRRYD